MTEIVMPRLSDSMEEGTILKWLKHDGEAVARGEPLAEIETDKATLTYESDAAGVLAIVAPAGETLPIGSVIARLENGGNGATAAASAPGHTEEAPPAAAPEPTPEATAMPTPPAASPPAPAPSAPPPAQRPAGRVKASPIARRLAREQGIDLHAIAGTGPGGRIVKDDVEQAAKRPAAAVPAQAAPAMPAASAPAPAAPAAPAAPPAVEAPAPAAAELPVAPPAPATVGATGTAKGDVTVQELTRIQGLIARRMAESRATIPSFELRTEIDMEACVALRAELKALGGDGPAGAVPSYNDMVVKACALALREFPRANGSYRDARFELYSRVNVGIAVATADSLVVPTVFDADRKSLREIAQEARALAERVRAGVITPPELSGGTFTVSNLGMYGVTDFTAVINPPQAAILAVGALAPRAAVAEGGAIVARHTMNVTLACDHRILYGAEAAEFLARIRALLERPLALAFA
jgi:pyruvate dehydrogenase E2 component (dihydrolipoamide acetyltransferase)